jgi:hypothetical protein
MKTYNQLYTRLLNEYQNPTQQKPITANSERYLALSKYLADNFEINPNDLNPEELEKILDNNELQNQSQNPQQNKEEKNQNNETSTQQSTPTNQVKSNVVSNIPNNSLTNSLNNLKKTLKPA